jgi:hypothetical protein
LPAPEGPSIAINTAARIPAFACCAGFGGGKPGARVDLKSTPTVDLPLEKASSLIAFTLQPGPVAMPDGSPTTVAVDLQVDRP